MAPLAERNSSGGFTMPSDDAKHEITHLTTKPDNLKRDNDKANNGLEDLKARLADNKKCLEVLKERYQELKDRQRDMETSLAEILHDLYHH